MKNLILTIFVFFSVSCKSQTPIINLHQNGTFELDGAYYKDVGNLYSPFVGTWILTTSTTYLKVVFKMKPMFERISSTETCYVDYLVGEYEYKENGVTKVNTLTNIDINHTSIFKYNLWSKFLVDKKYFTPCPNCLTNEKRLLMSFQELPTRDPNWAAKGEFFLRHVLENGVEKLEIQFVMRDSAGDIPTNLETDEQYQAFSLPFGNYTLNKQ